MTLFFAQHLLCGPKTYQKIQSLRSSKSSFTDHIKISRCPRLPYRFWPELSTDGKQLHLQALYILSQGGKKNRAVTAATEMHFGSLYWMLQDFWPLVSLRKAAISRRRKHSPNDCVRLSHRSRGFGLNADDPWDIRHGGITVVSEQRIVQKKEISNWRLTKKQFQNQIDSPPFFKFASMVGYIRGKRQSFTPSGWQASRFRITLPLQVFLNVFDKNCPLETAIPHISLYWQGSEHNHHKNQLILHIDAHLLQPRNRQPWLFMDGFA